MSADVASGVAPLRVNFTGNVLDPEGANLTYAWDFDSNGTTDATTKDATHVYTAVGTYTAKLTATDAGGRHQEATIRIEATVALATCPGDDEFSGSSLNRDKWTVVREDPAFMNVGDGSLNITSQNFDIHGGSTGLRNIVHQPLPTSGPWTAIIRANWDPTTNYNNAGLMVYSDDANFIKAGMVWSGGRRFEAFKELNNTATGLGAATGVLPAAFPSTWYLRLQSDGNTIQPAYSADGQTWTNYGSTTNLTSLTAPKIGVYATSASTTNREFKVDYFKLITPQSPTDDFEGDVLSLCRWTDIVRHEPGGYTVGGGKLTLPAAHGDFFGNGPNTNPNILLQKAPSGPFTMETRLTFNPNENYEQAGLLVYGDDANYVKANMVFSGNRALEFLRETNNTAAGFDGAVNIASRPTTVDVRIVSDGTTLRAYYRFDGDPGWTLFGEPAPLAGVGPNPKIGLYANDSNATVTTREDAVFDYFRVTTGVPDSTAPTSAATLDPPGGTSTGPVTVTLTGADNDGGSGLDKLEYRLDGGAWTTYSTPVTVSATGQHTLEHRATDKAGNVGAVGSVSFTIQPAGGGGDQEDSEVAARCLSPRSHPGSPGNVRRLHAGRDQGLPGLDHGHGDLECGQRGAHRPRRQRDEHGKLVNGEYVMPQALQVEGRQRRVRTDRRHCRPDAAPDLERAGRESHRHDRLQAVDRRNGQPASGRLRQDADVHPVDYGPVADSSRRARDGSPRRLSSPNNPSGPCTRAARVVGRRDRDKCEDRTPPGPAAAGVRNRRAQRLIAQAFSGGSRVVLQVVLRAQRRPDLALEERATGIEPPSLA